MHAMRECGWLVHDTSSQGNGFPDLVCARNGVVVLVEIKLARGKLTADQVAFMDNGWPVTIVRTVDDVRSLTTAHAVNDAR